jgi:hypothetical protein
MGNEISFTECELKLRNSLRSLVLTLVCVQEEGEEWGEKKKNAKS